ncbi:Na+/H+ antiporter NhaC family protein [Gallaecimonas xiamenensis]|uniref:Na+/H+ antiporter NhaC n=1 Tax=Gallaecimonas xiamenensis 3-C-1 TaxID=745411 RepID=K2J3K3_9GAMM|nr:Na+/H+ antiporter NhaC family protein [Gallaecimonas xiamenensis]EKE77581.1 Na+/H+ antiporter NhaC [Gallaecimonas xiamenensis 3-C-1]
MHWYSIVPPLVAIAFVFWKKDVIGALLLAILSSEGLQLLAAGQFGLGQTGINGVDRVVAVFGSAGNVQLLMFSVLIGAFLALIRESGGVSATVDWLGGKGLAKTARRSRLITMLTGVAVFVESNLSVLTAGILARGLFDKFKMSRAQLAYLIDSTSAPVCILILLNGWGAYILALLSDYPLEGGAVQVLWGTVPLNFYALVTLAIAFYVAFTGKVFGPMKESERQLDQGLAGMHSVAPTKVRYMVLPLVTLVGGMAAFMLWSGEGDITQGNGSLSMLYATLCGILVAYLLLVWNKDFSHKRLMDLCFSGMGELLPLVTIVLLSIALGASLKALGTGAYIAGLVGSFLPLVLVAPVLFLAGAAMSFTTGTSWGTFAILIPLGMPLVQSLGLPPELVLAAILGGGIFGDHCSPISDTTAVSSIASGCDLLEHVRTQLPYALVAGGISLVLYFLAGLVMI